MLHMGFCVRLATVFLCGEHCPMRAVLYVRVGHASGRLRASLASHLATSEKVA